MQYTGSFRNQNLDKVAIVMEVANSHRLPIVADLAKTLSKNMTEVLIVCEERLALAFEGSDDIFTINFEHDINQLRQSCRLNNKIEIITIDNYVEESFSGLEESNILRETAISELLGVFSPDLTIVWSGNFSFQKGTLAAIKKNACKVFFLEVAWFSQKGYIYLDEAGVNYKSNLRKQALSKINPNQLTALEVWLKNYKNNKFTHHRNSEEVKKIFVPLQVDTDTSIQQSSPFKSMGAFVSFLETWIPNEIEVIFKAHPKAKYTYLLQSKRKNFLFVYEGRVEDYLTDCDLVLGLNSTVLLEARIYTHKVISFAKGIFSGKGILFEATAEDTFDDSIKCLNELSELRFNEFYYELIFNRQISLEKLKKEDLVHLFSRSPFEIFSLSEPYYLERLKQQQISEGKIMLKIGHSKIAKSASLDVDAEGVIEIGNNCEVRHHAVLEVSGKYNGTIKIGNGSVVGVGNWFQGSGEIIVEDNVIIGPYVAIVSTNHQYENTEIPISLQPLTLGKVHIKEGVWIGAHCTIAQNVTIGKHAIIAANSFVNKDVPDWGVVGGAPAKLLKMRDGK